MFNTKEKEKSPTAKKNVLCKKERRISAYLSWRLHNDHEVDEFNESNDEVMMKLPLIITIECIKFSKIQ